jgi:hypothetical protein
MKNIANGIMLMPTRMEANQTLTIKTEDQFLHPQYIITDSNGKLIRRGTISEGATEIKLCMAGVRSGSYFFNLGPIAERFIIE